MGNLAGKGKRPILPTGRFGWTATQLSNCAAGFKRFTTDQLQSEVVMQYEVKALRGNEGLLVLLLEAADANDAEVQAKAQGYTVLTTRAKQRWSSLRQRNTRFPLVLFSQELVALLKAGLPLIE